MLKTNNSIFGTFGKLIALALAVIVTATLIFTMHLLIKMAKPTLDTKPSFTIPKFVRIPEPETVNVTPPPEKPPEVQAQPEKVAQRIKPNVKVEGIAYVPIDTSVSIVQAKGGLELNAADGEYLPIVKIAPVYPRRAAERCKEGYVIVGFTVTTSGSVENPVVVETSSALFNRAAIKAASQFKYKPRMSDGVPQSVPNVKNKITFQMDTSAC